MAEPTHDEPTESSLGPTNLPESGDCAICLESLALHTEHALECGHRYHAKCIIDVFRGTHARPSNRCPLCRAVPQPNTNTSQQNTDLVYLYDNGFSNWPRQGNVPGRLVSWDEAVTELGFRGRVTTRDRQNPNENATIPTAEDFGFDPEFSARVEREFESRVARDDSATGYNRRVGQVVPDPDPEPAQVVSDPEAVQEDTATNAGVVEFLANLRAEQGAQPVETDLSRLVGQVVIEPEPAFSDAELQLNVLQASERELTLDELWTQAQNWVRERARVAGEEPRPSSAEYEARAADEAHERARVAGDEPSPTSADLFAAHVQQYEARANEAHARNLRERAARQYETRAENEVLERARARTEQRHSLVQENLAVNVDLLLADTRWVIDGYEKYVDWLQNFIRSGYTGRFSWGLKTGLSLLLFNPEVHAWLLVGAVGLAVPAAVVNHYVSRLLSYT